MSEQDPVVIVGMGRTPMGGLLGDLASLTASELGAIAIEKAVSEAKLAPGEANEIITVCLKCNTALYVLATPMQQKGVGYYITKHCDTESTV